MTIANSKLSREQRLQHIQQLLTQAKRHVNELRPLQHGELDLLTTLIEPWLAQLKPHREEPIGRLDHRGQALGPEEAPLGQPAAGDLRRSETG